MWNVILDKMIYQKVMSCANRDGEQSELRNSKREGNVKQQGRLCSFKTGFMYVVYIKIRFVPHREHSLKELERAIC